MNKEFPVNAGHKTLLTHLVFDTDRAVRTLAFLPALHVCHSSGINRIGVVDWMSSSKMMLTPGLVLKCRGPITAAFQAWVKVSFSNTEIHTQLCRYKPQHVTTCLLTTPPTHLPTSDTCQRDTMTAAQASNVNQLAEFDEPLLQFLKPISFSWNKISLASKKEQNIIFRSLKRSAWLKGNPYNQLRI